MLQHSFYSLFATLSALWLLLAASASAAAISGTQLRPRPRRSELLPVRSADGPVRPHGYLVRYRSDVNATEVHTQIAHDFGSQSIRYRYRTASFNGMAGTFNDAQLEELRASPDVDAIEEDSIGHADTIVAQADAPWGLQRISQTASLRYGDVTALSYVYTYDDSAGSGVDIYIMDSGINISHQDFGGRARWGKTFGGYTPDTDGYGHGTHVAGTAAGSRFGVAKKANLIAVRVLDAQGSGYSSDAISAVQWVIAQAKSTGRPSVLNISVKYSPNDMLDAAVTDAINAGVHVVVSAGNSSSNASTQSPARAPAVTCVGATDINDQMAYYSNYGPLVDMFAPGTSITSAWIGSNTATKVDTGTSMAAPHVAGTTAYLIGRFGNQKPELILGLMKSLSTPNILGLVGPNTTNIMVGNGVYLDPFNDHSTTITITRQNGDALSTTSIRYTAATDTGAAAATVTSGAAPDSPNRSDASGATVAPDTAINVDTASPAQAFAVPTMTA